MVDLESVRRRLREIDRRVALLASLHERGREAYVADVGLQAQAERHLQLAIQSVIDIAFHLLAEDAGPTPENYGSALVMLATEGLVERALADRLRLATGLRNVLVHGYLEVDPTLVWDHLTHLDDLRAFALAIERHLSGGDLPG